MTKMIVKILAAEEDVAVSCTVCLILDVFQGVIFQGKLWLVLSLRRGEI